MTDGRVVAGTADRGSGFLLTDRTVVTAAHVVRNRQASDLAFVTSTGRRVAVTAVELAPEIDAAALTLAQPLSDAPVPVVGRVAPYARWRVTARPEPAAAQLTGLVSAVDHRVENAQGYEMVVLQLEVAEGLGEYQGYSGGAVTVDGALVGMLVEQVRERTPSAGTRRRRASNVLYAVRAADIAAHFGLDLPVDVPARSGWREDLRRLLDELADDPDLPDELSRPETVAVQMYTLLAMAFAGGNPGDPGWLADRIRRLWHRSSMEEPVYRLAAATPLTAVTLRSMLDRLARVHATATALPKHVRRPRYRIEAPGTVLADPGAEIDRWLTARVAEADDDHRYDEETLRGMLDRLDPPVFEGDPVGELIALLNNDGWDKPSQIAYALVREVFVRGADAELEPCLEKILTRIAPTEVTMLTAAHRQPDHVTRNDHGYLVNRQPTLYHLEHGYLAVTDVLDEFEREYWSWYERVVVGLAHAGGREVPMFWITGPSGAGKSVLLLQLLARLNARSGVSVLLPPAGARLTRATRWATELCPTRQVVIGVDDPLSWTEDDERPAWPEVFRALGHRRQTTSMVQFPVFVCCAPTEHRAEFERTYGRTVRVGGMALDPYRPEFTAQLRGWYALRTGAPPPPVPRQGVPMPAQMFLEWRSGEGIQEYAERFQRRIDSQGLPELRAFFTHLLAVNRLYVGYPQEAVAALSEQTRQAFDAYRTDMHVQLSGEGGRPGYWFAHPHVADLMYDVWFPPGERDAQRADHLRDALLDAVAAVPRGWAAVPLLRRLRAAVGRGPQPRTGEQDEKATARATDPYVRAALAEAVGRIGPGLADLASPVLAEWVRVERQLRLPGSHWRPRECAIARLAGRPDQGMDELVRALVELEDRGVDAELWAYLRRNPEWEGWLTVAGPLVRRWAGFRDVDLLAPVVETTLVRQPAAVALLIDALATAADNGPLVRLAHRLVAGELTTEAPLAPLVTALYLRDRNRMRGRNPLAVPIHRGFIRDWLGPDPRPEHRTVYEEVLNGPVPPMLRSALEAWVRAFPAERLAGAAVAQWLNWPWLDGKGRDVLHAHLEQCDEVDPRLVDKVRQLLSHDGPGWSRLFTLLPAAWVRDPLIRARALAWLRKQRPPSAWHWAYSHLCAATAEPDHELRQLGESHIASCREHSCGYVRYWVLQVTPAAERPAAARDTFQWLRGRPDLARAWGLLGGQILRTTPSDDVDQIVETFIAWVREHPDDSSTPQVLIVSVAADTSPAVRQRLLACVDEWLSVPRPGWARTYLTVRPLLGVERSTALAMPWLLSAVDDRGWLRVLSATADQLDAAQLSGVLRRWFAATPTGAAARPLWRIAVEDGPCPELVRDPSFRSVVAGWLARGGDTTAAWRPIARGLIAADPVDPAPLRAVLTGTIPTHSIYGFADDLEDLLRTRPEVAEPMRRLLATFDRTPAWRIVWRRLVSVAPSDHAWRVSLALLADETPDAFAPLWVRLWDAYPDDERRRLLRGLAEHRLAGQPVDDPVWRHVRRKLAVASGTQGDRDPDRGRDLIIPATTPTPPLPVPGAADGPPEPWQCRLVCPGCGTPFDLTVGGGARQARWTCLRCDHDLTIDTGTLAVTAARQMTRTPGRLVAVGGRAPRLRPRMRCDRCGRELVANVPGAEGAYLAVDRECDRLYEVTAAEVTDFVEHARYVAAGRAAGEGGPAPGEPA